MTAARCAGDAASAGGIVVPGAGRTRRPHRRAGGGSLHRALGTMLALLGLLLCAAPAGAADIPYNFEDPARQAQYLRLIAELRCLVCQNQSLADSSADLAQDLRDEVYRMVADGQSDERIVEFLVARYGDFVLYRPPLNALTVLLWFGPALLVALAGIAWWRLARRRGAAGATALAPEEQAALAALLDRDRDSP